MEVHLFRKERSAEKGEEATCRLKMKKERNKIKTWERKSEAMHGA